MPLSGGRFLLRFTRDAHAVEESNLVALRRYLAPLLPEGLRALDQYRGPVPYKL